MILEARTLDDKQAARMLAHGWVFRGQVGSEWRLQWNGGNWPVDPDAGQEIKTCGYSRYPGTMPWQCKHWPDCGCHGRPNVSRYPQADHGGNRRGATPG